MQARRAAMGTAMIGLATAAAPARPRTTCYN
mgnify:CR=1 FL=1